MNPQSLVSDCVQNTTVIVFQTLLAIIFTLPLSAYCQNQSTTSSLKHKAAQPTNIHSVKGTVKITGQFRGKKADPQDTILVLEPKDPSSAASRPAKEHLVDMKNRTYVPGVLLIRSGDSVGFRNSDPFKHNVFSLSTPNDFDLGTYRTDKTVSYTFTDTGIVLVYCNIHRSMALFIMVSHGDWGTLAADDGSFVIDGVPPGEYTLTAWNVRGNFSQLITVGESAPPEFSIEIDTAGYTDTGHHNKYGKPYPKSSRTEREFY